VIIGAALLTSFALGVQGVPVVPRLVASLGLALVLIAASQLWERRYGGD
jgi:hypothetical protein